MEYLLNTKEAAKYIGMSKAFLERDRWTGNPQIPFVKVGSRAVRYRKNDLDSYISSRLQGARTTI